VQRDFALSQPTVLTAIHYGDGLNPPLNSITQVSQRPVQGGEPHIKIINGLPNEDGSKYACIVKVYASFCVKGQLPSN
jgi:hypothetical protein